MIQALFSGEKVVSNSSEAFSLHEKSRFGEKESGRVAYSLVEALYLVSSGKMKVFSGKKEVDFDFLMKKMGKIDKRVETKFYVFRDLRRKGYIVKTALKFGADFRVYEKGVKPGEEHARWVLYAVRETEEFGWHEFAAKNRVAHSANKNLLLGIVDEEGSVTYYEVRWMKI